MSHLGELTSALVDGELTGTELDRANAHLAACAACRAEAAMVRRIKSELRALAEVDGADALTRRLLAMPGPRGPSPRDPGPRDPGPRDPLRSRKLPRGRDRRVARRRGRYLVWGAVSIVVAGVGAAAFGMGGGSGSGPAEPQITPQLEMLDLQHAATSGDVPFANSPRTSLKAATKTATKTATKAATRP